MMYTQDIPFRPVEEPKIGQLYHVTWARKRGMVWRCVSIDKESQTVMLMTPKTKKMLAKPVKITELRHTRAQQHKS